MNPEVMSYIKRARASVETAKQIHQRLEQTIADLTQTIKQAQSRQLAQTSAISREMRKKEP